MGRVQNCEPAVANRSINHATLKMIHMAHGRGGRTHMVPNKQLNNYVGKPKAGHNVDAHCCPPCGPTPLRARRQLRLLRGGPRSHRQTVDHPSWRCHFRATKLFDLFGMIPSVFEPSGQVNHQTLKSSQDGIPTMTVNCNFFHMSEVGLILPA